MSGLGAREGAQPYNGSGRDGGRKVMQSKLVVIALVGLLCLALAAVGQGAGNLVYNGDFELASPGGLPPGWTMWGDEKWKTPGNYTRDSTNPHGGKASFRIDHPAGTAGYVVSSPEHAIQPRKGRRYTITFWARADRPGTAHFGLTAYARLQPFADAPSPGEWPLETEGQWKQFRFTIDEGWDFFADRSRYLLLTYHATGDDHAARTLWVDDIVVTEQRSPRAGRLVDESALPHEPLQHRLRPGRSLDISVDVRKPLRRAIREVGGISFHRVSGWTGEPYDREGKYTLAPQLEQAIRDLHLPTTRFYAVGDERYSLEASLDKVAEVCRRVGAPLDHVVLELEAQGADSTLAPGVWARGVRYAKQQGYGFRYWEVANEPYLMREGTAFTIPQAYIDHFLAVSKAIRAVQPGAQIGIAIDPESQAWGNRLLRQCAGRYDFVVGHHYAWISHFYERPFEVPALAANYAKLDLILRLNALIRAYNPGRNVYQYDTEWGLICSGPEGEVEDAVDRNANIVGTVHRAVRLIYYAREGMLRGASSWQMLNRPSDQGFGILARSARRNSASCFTGCTTTSTATWASGRST